VASVHIARFADMQYAFNISAGVGKNRPNQRLDVMLVQYLLNLATNESVVGPISSLTPIRPPEQEEDLVPDGICGTKTMRAIAFYQQFRNRNATFSDDNQMGIAVQVKEDGAIDPWRFPADFNFVNSFGKPLGPTFTLIALSYDAAKNSDVKQGFFSQMPKELARILRAH